MAKFSKQDYVSIARVIDDTWSQLHAAAVTTEQRFGVKVDMEAVVTAFADMFAEDNSHFDRARFVAAAMGGAQ